MGGAAYIAGFMAGAKIIGPVNARAIVLSMSSATPVAILQSMLAVAGATSMASAWRAQSMCAILPASGSSKAHIRHG